MKWRGSREGLRIFPAVEQHVADLKSYDRQRAAAQNCRDVFGIVAAVRDRRDRLARIVGQFFEVVGGQESGATRTRRIRAIETAAQVSMAVRRRIAPMVDTKVHTS